MWSLPYPKTHLLPAVYSSLSSTQQTTAARGRLLVSHIIQSSGRPKWWLDPAAPPSSGQRRLSSVFAVTSNGERASASAVLLGVTAHATRVTTRAARTCILTGRESRGRGVARNANMHTPFRWKALEGERTTYPSTYCHRKGMGHDNERDQAHAFPNFQGHGFEGAGHARHTMASAILACLISYGSMSIISPQFVSRSSPRTRPSM